MKSQRQKVTFAGSLGNELAGLLELPAETPRSTVLFAHCFTCGKDIAAAARIARALANRGFAVLRFDFTGLGASDGEFANTTFSSNVDDLVAAAAFLRQQHLAPSVLVGHSLGGTAVLHAAAKIPEARGVVTLGSPATAEHVAKQFACDIETIEREGGAEVTLGGRQFTVKQEFLDDIRQHGTAIIGRLKQSLLVMHSPLDAVVSINEAEAIYRAAKHPKSFITLGNADHLLSRRSDADYAAEVISAWSSNFLPAQTIKSRPELETGQVQVSEAGKKFLQDVFTDSHHWLADEPVKIGGTDRGPDPYEHLLAALGACTSMTIRMYAERKQWKLNNVSVVLDHHREHGDDCAMCDTEHPRIDVITRKISFDGDLDNTQRQRLLEIADKCPVHRTMHNKLDIRTIKS